MVITNNQLWYARRDVAATLDLYCGDFDLIFNNPASLVSRALLLQRTTVMTT
ncbi:MAG: hypothetical protein H6556_18665 [Lewinellaceae bacterium]|nr:hypothetical protein [Lewinellaceae bacterium]